MPSLHRRTDGAAPTGCPSGLLIDAESDWIVEGSLSEIDAISASIGPAASTRISSGVLLLRFGNSVGRVPAGPLGLLIVRTGKWREEDYDALLEDLSRVTAALPFAASSPSSLPYERTELYTEEVLYHAFVWLRHALLREHDTELHDALAAIQRSPHRRLVRSAREVPLAFAGRLSSRTLEDIASGRWPLATSPLGFQVGEQRVLPQCVEEERALESVDTAENRFVKAFLAECGHIIDRIRARLGRGDDNLARRVRVDCEQLDEVLTTWRRAPLWREVGQMAHFPEASTVLHRRHEYRTIFRHHQMLRLGSRVPLDPETVRTLIESKDIATLYEMWSAFVLIEEIGMLLGPPAHMKRVAFGDKGASLGWGLVGRWADGTELAYNHTYTHRVGFHGLSRSLRLRPDVALFVPGGPGAGLHLFDGKFRIEGSLDPEAEASYQSSDLHKMHAYRDAIPTVRSAWVLYPGDEVALFFDDGRRKLSGKVGVPDGVGVLPLRPGLGREVLRELLGCLL